MKSYVLASRNDDIQPEEPLEMHTVVDRALRRLKLQLKSLARIVSSYRRVDIRSKNPLERERAIRIAFEVLTKSRKGDIPDLPELRSQFIWETLEMTKSDQLLRLLDCWQEGARFDLFQRLLGEPRPSSSDWQNVFRPVEYEFRTSWHYWVIFCLTAAISLISLFEMATNFTTGAATLDNMTEIAIRFVQRLFSGKPANFELWSRAVMVVTIETVIMIIAYWYVFGRKQSETGDRIVMVFVTFLGPFVVLPLGMLLAPILVIMALSDRERGVVERLVSAAFIGPMTIIASVFLSLLSLVILLFANLSIADYVSWQFAIGMWLIILAAIGVLALIGRRKDRAARNPLHGILDESLHSRYRR